MKSTRSIYRQKPLSHERQSEWVSERANEWAQWTARTKWWVRSKQMSEQCKRTSKLRSEWPSAQRVNFICFQPNVQRGPISRTVFIASNFHGLPCTLTLTQWLANTHNTQNTHWPLLLSFLHAVLLKACSSRITLAIFFVILCFFFCLIFPNFIELILLQILHQVR